MHATRSQNKPRHAVIHNELCHERVAKLSYRAMTSALCISFFAAVDGNKA